MLQEIFGFALILTGILDAIKYVIQASKIRKEKSAEAMSRRFVNYAILNDIVKLGYGLVIRDLFIISTSVLALVCMLYLFWTVYIFYSYETYPRRVYIKRPSLWKYTINSIVPNNKRKHL
jgi:lipid-A-disaccharide synthase-like uncharacterized protein